MSYPDGRESHYLTIATAFTKCLRDPSYNRLIINVPPRYGKTELVINFIAWSLALFPDSNFIYTSYGLELAKKQTQTVKQIIELPLYRNLFGVSIKTDTSAKHNFETTGNGAVYAAGAEGTITGRGAGIKHAERFSGAILIDDIHKPGEVASDTMRDSIKTWYDETLSSRTNNPNVPIIFIGQRLHEDDLAANLIKTGDWETIIIPALDEHNNPLHEQMHSRAALLKMKEKSPYMFAAQYQQDPQPAGGGIFKPEWFVLTDEEPDILATLITADTAETDKSYNDATVFSFWGIHRIYHGKAETNMYGLHWLNCIELRVEPKDLESEFYKFYTDCMMHRVKPRLIAIEKKSTGITLLSVLSKFQGLQTKEIERTKASGSKTSRFLSIQYHVASKHISLPRYGKHTHMCIEHCKGITANNSHAHDDIADTLYDAVKLGLIDNVLISQISTDKESDQVINHLSNKFQRVNTLRRASYENHYARA